LTGARFTNSYWLSESEKDYVISVAGTGLTEESPVVTPSVEADRDRDGRNTTGKTVAAAPIPIAMV